MGRRASKDESLREAPLLPGLAPSPPEGRDGEPVGQRGAAASAGAQGRAPSPADDAVRSTPLSSSFG